jgi:pilus assembly protein CpaF
MVSLQDIFLFEKQGLGLNGKVQGRFLATGIVPKFSEKLAAAGFPLALNMMDQSVEV